MLRGKHIYWIAVKYCCNNCSGLQSPIVYGKRTVTCSEYIIKNEMKKYLRK